MKFALAAIAIVVLSAPACTTLQNRRDMYFPQKVNGPYTRMLREGLPSPKPVSGEVRGGSDGKTVVR